MPPDFVIPSEFLVTVVALHVNSWLALLGSMGMILGLMYMLFLYRRIIYGRLTNIDLRDMLNLSPREIATFAPLVVITIWMGAYPITSRVSRTALLPRWSRSINNR